MTIADYAQRCAATAEVITRTHHGEETTRLRCDQPINHYGDHQEAVADGMVWRWPQDAYAR
jgi:hypothetical protein